MTLYNKQGRIEVECDVDLLISNKYNFTNHDLSGLDLTGRVFRDMYFDTTDFSRADISKSTFINCHLRGAKFERTTMEGCTFIKCNFRESDFTQCFLTGSIFDKSNLINSTFCSSQSGLVEWNDCDMRNTNFRGADLTRSDFKGSRIKGINTRNCTLNRCKNIPSWMTDTMLKYRLSTEDDFINTGYKLTNEDSGGIYHPVLEYKVGSTYTVKDVHPIKNPGIAIAPLDWILREWVMLGAQPKWKLFEVQFKTGDILGEEGAIKFNVREIKVTKEIPLSQFLDDLSD